jgi:hypothetical protein
MAHAVKSAVWTYFDTLEDDNTKAMCKVYQEKSSRIVIIRGGKTCKQFTTTNLSTEKRSRLAPHKADNILFLHHNLRD